MGTAEGEAELAALATTVGERLQAAGWLLATAESCTGGWIAKTVTDIPGSSAWFSGGIVAYANAIKTRLLGVDDALLRDHGAVSREVVEAMAVGARMACGADWACAVSGVAGPGGGSAEKPVGLVWVAWAGPDGTISAAHHFSGDRAAVRRQTVAASLSGLLEALPERTA